MFACVRVMVFACCREKHLADEHGIARASCLQLRRVKAGKGKKSVAVPPIISRCPRPYASAERRTAKSTAPTGTSSLRSRRRGRADSAPIHCEPSSFERNAAWRVVRSILRAVFLFGDPGTLACRGNAAGDLPIPTGSASFSFQKRKNTGGRQDSAGKLHKSNNVSLRVESDTS